MAITTMENLPEAATTTATEKIAITGKIIAAGTGTDRYYSSGRTSQKNLIPFWIGTDFTCALFDLELTPTRLEENSVMANGDRRFRRTQPSCLFGWGYTSNRKL